MHLFVGLASRKAIGAGKVAGINNRNTKVSMGAVEGVRQRYLIHPGSKGREKRRNASAPLSTSAVITQYAWQYASTLRQAQCTALLSTSVGMDMNASHLISFPL